MSKTKLLTLALFLFVTGISLNHSSPTTQVKGAAIAIATPTLNPASTVSPAYTVTRVIDGDTIELNTGERVRYIGIDTPETNECFYSEATKQNQNLVLGKQVKLEKDISQTDKYGRLLRYVWIDDVFVNDYLIRQGFAHAATFPPDIKYQDQFTASQREAVSQNRGLWKTCVENSSPTPPPISDTNCPIKGNINAAGEKIYHLPGCKSYSKTQIDTNKGERWFCSETDAASTGWRRASNCN